MYALRIDLYFKRVMSDKSERSIHGLLSTLARYAQSQFLRTWSWSRMSSRNCPAPKVRVRSTERKGVQKDHANQSGCDCGRQPHSQSFEYMVKAFHEFDIDKSGTMNEHELRLVLRHLGQNPTDEQLQELMAKADQDSSGSLDIDEFLRLVKMTFDFCDDDPTSSLETIFRLLDPSGRGFVTVGDVKKLIVNFNTDPDWSRNDMKHLFENRRNEDTMNLSDFIRMVTDTETASLDRVNKF